MIDIQALAKQAGALPIHERPKELALCGKKELEAFAALVLEAAAVECDTSADRIAPKGKRTNQVDRHVAEVLKARATAIRALKPELNP
jgi:hypothetical protein